MIFRAIACDYDGTLATHDRIGSEVLGALARTRQGGLRLILVTGRVFFELIRVCERLDLFDVVVAENGGVLYFPGGGTIRNMAPPPPSELLSELERRAVFFRVGRTIVDMARSDAEHAREALTATHTRMDLVFNRGSLMLLPPGISKGTGVRGAIQALGLTGHEVLALGDAENDLDFFDACDWRACPENAVAELKQQADWVFPGENGTAIARAIIDHILPGRLAVARSPRHQLMIGWATRSGELVGIPERDVNVLIQGDPVSGKSWLAGLLAERLVERRYSVCVIDPEGDYSGLASLPGASWSDIRNHRAVMRSLQRFEQEPGALVVLDLSTLDHVEKVHLIDAALERVQELRQLNEAPHWVILDEAHYSLHAGGVGEHAVGLEGRGFCLVTCRMSWVRGSFLKQIDLTLFTRTTASAELEFVRSRLGTAGFAGDLASVLPDLPQGQGVGVGLSAATDLGAETFAVAPRATTHVRHLRKYVDNHLPPHHCFLFRSPDGCLVATADSLSAFRHAVAVIPAGSLGFHAGREDFSRWMRDVFRDRALARQLRKVEARWKRGEIHNLRDALARPLAVAMGGVV